MSETAALLKRVGLTVLALLVLLALSLGSSHLNLGSGNLAASLLIASMKAALVVTIFMKAGRSVRLVRLVLVASLAWLALLLSLGSLDFLTRDVQPAAWQVPRQIEPAVEQLDVRPPHDAAKRPR